MAILIDENPANEYYGEQKSWLIGDRFELITYKSNNRFSLFISDRTQKLNSLKLIPQILREFNLLDDPMVTLAPSIDTCGINLPESRYDEVFKTVEDYLLKL